MKKALLSIIALMLLCQVAEAQQKQAFKDSLRDSYTQEFVINPFSFFVGGFELGYGKIKNNRNTRGILGYYYSENPDFYDDGYDNSFPSTTVKYKNMEGFRAEFQYLFMKPTDGGLKYYGGPYGIFKTIKMDITRTSVSSNATVVSDYVARGTSGSVGVIAGVRSFAFDNIFIDLYIGGGITFPFSGSNIDDVHLSVLNPYKRSINPRAGLTLGLAF